MNLRPLSQKREFQGENLGFLLFLVTKIGRGERIRTSGPCLPKTVLYQAELLPYRMRGGETPARQARPISVDCGTSKRAFASFYA